MPSHSHTQVDWLLSSSKLLLLNCLLSRSSTILTCRIFISYCTISNLGLLPLPFFVALSLSPLSSWNSLHLPLKWHKDHTQWVRPCRVPWDPGNKGALSLTPTEIKSQHCHFPSPVTCSKSLSPSVLRLPPFQTGIVTGPPS